MLLKLIPSNSKYGNPFIKANFQKAAAPLLKLVQKAATPLLKLVQKAAAPLLKLILKKRPPAVLPFLEGKVQGGFSFRKGVFDYRGCMELNLSGFL